MKNKGYKRHNNIIDLTAILTATGAIFYIFGSIYIHSYCEYFNIPGSLIDFPFEKMIESTWRIFVILSGSFSLILYYVFHINKNNKFMPILGIMGTVILTLLLLFLLAFLLDELNIIKYIFGLTFFLIVLFYAVLYKRKSLGQVNKRLFVTATLPLIFLICFLLHLKKAKIDALKFKSNYEENVEIYLNYNREKIYGKYIMYSNNKHFVLIENSKCQLETVIINNDEVHRIKMLNKTIDN